MCRVLESYRLHRCLTNWKLEYGFKLLLRRYSGVSDLNTSKDQRKKHRPYYDVYIISSQILSIYCPKDNTISDMTTNLIV